MFHQPNRNQKTLLAMSLLCLSSLSVAAEARNESELRHLDLQQIFSTELAKGHAGIDARWQLLGKANFARGEATFATELKSAAEAIPGESQADLASRIDVKSQRQWIAVNVRTGDEYLIELPVAAAKSLRVLARQAGWQDGDAGPVDEASPESFNDIYDADLAKGWSNGSDTRTRRFNNTTYPYRAMGQIGGGLLTGCSGTLVGPRHVLTAAHCLYNTDSDQWTLGGKFRAGREGTCNTASCEPYGEQSGVWYFTPAAWRAADGAYQYDYGMMVMDSSPGTGWLGYAAV